MLQVRVLPGVLNFRSWIRAMDAQTGRVIRAEGPEGNSSLFSALLKTLLTRHAQMRMIKGSGQLHDPQEQPDAGVAEGVRLNTPAALPPALLTR